MTNHLEAAFLLPLQKSPITYTGCRGVVTGLLMLARNITVCSASCIHLCARAGGCYRTLGPQRTDPLGLTWLSLSCPTTLLSFLQRRQTMRAGKAGTCSLFLHLSPSSPPSSASFEDRVLEVFVLATFPYKPYKVDQFCLAAKDYYSRKYWGRSTSGQWCYHRRRDTSYLLFLFFPFFLTKIETNHMTKYFKMNSQLLCRSHNQYVTVERGMAEYNLPFKFKWKIKQLKKFQQTAVCYSDPMQKYSTSFAKIFWQKDGRAEKK